MEKMTRRDVLKLAGVGGCAAAIGVAGGMLLAKGAGECFAQENPASQGSKAGPRATNAVPPKATPNAEAAKAMFEKGFNCAQAVLCSCGKSFGLPQETGVRIGQAFGGGMGMMGLTCSAVTGACMTIGIKCVPPNANTPPPADDCNRLVRELTKRFTDLHGSICCRELLGHDISTPEGLKAIVADGSFTTKCPIFVRDAVALVEELLPGKTDSTG